MEEMQRRLRKVNMSYYISPKTISSVYKALNMAVPQTRSATNGFNGNDDDEQDGEIVDEDVVDEFIIGEP